MSERIVLLTLIASAAATAAEMPGLGEPLTEAEADRISFTVMPDGSGLPPGSGTANAGKAVYATHCVACHGQGGSDGINDRLVGGQGTIASDKPVKTVGSYWPYATTLFDYVRRAMPFHAPGSLSADELYSVTAYLLFLNDIVDDDETIDADSLPRIRMPNRDNFSWAVEVE